MESNRHIGVIGRCHDSAGLANLDQLSGRRTERRSAREVHCTSVATLATTQWRRPVSWSRWLGTARTAPTAFRTTTFNISLEIVLALRANATPHGVPDSGHKEHDTQDESDSNPFHQHLAFVR